MDLTTYTKNKVYDHVHRNVAYTSPIGNWVAIFTAAPTDAGGGTEVTDIAPRQAMTASAPTDGEGGNSGELLWAAAVAGYTAVAIGIYDASTGGNLLMWKAISEVVAAGVKFRYVDDALDIDWQ